MRIGVPRETWPGELRAALVPLGINKLKQLGFELIVQSGVGEGARLGDSEYRDAGATVVENLSDVTANADVVLRVRKPRPEDVRLLKSGAVHVSFLDPFNERDLVRTLAHQGVTSISMEMIPRTTRAQKMDALSSQASLAGYVTVVLAAAYAPRILPMMMTPAGTIPPSRVFVIGAGVAGLQAIATAKRLGARVEAFDTRPVVAEQVESLGAKFLRIDLGETGQTAQGYARELTAEQLAVQREGMKKTISQSDIVITTAQVFGRPAPKIVTADMVQAMKPGSIIVDMAIESGGNVEGAKLDQVANVNGVSIVGLGNLPSHVSRNASEMYSSNLVNLLGDFWKADRKELLLDPGDDIVKGCVITRGGEVVNDTIKKLMS
jgi:NAD(P) transhydrogenase subunit alpha